MKNRYVSLGLAFGLGIAVACTKSVMSGPQFVFKDAPAAGQVAKIKDRIVTAEEAFKPVSQELYEAEMKVYDIKFNQIKTMMLEEFVKAEAKGLSTEEYLEKNVAKDINVSDKEIEAFVKEKQIPSEHVNDQLKGRIRDFIRMEKQREVVDAWLNDQSKKNPVEIYLTKPERPRFAVPMYPEELSWGEKDAKVTVVEFSDFQCPFCAKGAELLGELKKKYGKKIRVVFKNYPLPMHKDAFQAAKAALCAQEQSEEAFWKLHDKMFADQAGLAREGLIAKARDLKLDSDKFGKCIDSTQYTTRVERDMKDGESIGVRSTPTFFINGVMINGARDLAEFSEVIDQELAR